MLVLSFGEATGRVCKNRVDEGIENNGWKRMRGSRSEELGWRRESRVLHNKKITYQKSHLLYYFHILYRDQ